MSSVVAVVTATHASADALDRREASRCPRVEPTRSVKGHRILEPSNASCVDRYVSFCRAFGVSPNSGVLSALRSVDSDGPAAIVSLDMSRHLVGPRGLLPLIDIFVNCPNLASLRLASSALDDTACGALLRALRPHPALRLLDLSDNHITSTSLPALRLYCSETGSHVRLDGNPGLFPSSVAALAKLSLAARRPGSSPPLPPPTRVSSQRNRPPATESRAGDSHAGISQVIRRRLEQRDTVLPSQRALRRLPVNSEGWMCVAVYASLPFHGFAAEADLLESTILPQVNRRLRARKIHLRLTHLHAPPYVSPPSVGYGCDGDFYESQSAQFERDASIAKNANVRAEVVRRNTDIFLCFTAGGSDRCGATETAVDWAAKRRLGDGAVATLVYERASVRSLPDALLLGADDLCPSPVGSLPPYQRTARHDLAKAVFSVPTCMQFSYTAMYRGITEHGHAVIEPSGDLVSTLTSDLYTSALHLASRPLPSKPSFNPFDEFALAGLADKPPVQNSAVTSVVTALEEAVEGAGSKVANDISGRQVIVLYGPPGSGKSTQLNALATHLQRSREWCVVVKHRVLSGPRALDAVLQSLLQLLGLRDRLRGWYTNDSSDVAEAFCDALNTYNAPPTAKCVTLLVDDGDRVTARTDGSGMGVFANIDQSRLRTRNGVPVAIVYTADSGPESGDQQFHQSPSASSTLPRMFVRRVPVPSLTEVEAVTVLVGIMKSNRWIRGPRGEEAARRAGAHLTLHKEDGCRPLYMLLASFALQHCNEETTMISIADGLPDRLPELARTVLNPSTHRLRLASVLCAARVAVGAETGLTEDVALLAAGSSRDPHDPRGGPSTWRHRRSRGWWAYLVDDRAPPLAAMDLALARLLWPGLLHSGEGEAATSCRSSLSFASASVESVFVRALDLFSVDATDGDPADVETASIATQPPTEAEAAFQLDSRWTRLAIRMANALRRLAQRSACVAHHRLQGFGLCNMHPRDLARVVSPSVLFYFLQRGCTAELRRQWREMHAAGLFGSSSSRDANSQLAALDGVLRRHWDAIVDGPANIFYIVPDTSRAGDGRRLPIGDDTAAPATHPFDLAVQAAFDSDAIGGPVCRLEPVSIVSVIGGLDPSRPLPTRDPADQKAVTTSKSRPVSACSASPTTFTASPVRLVSSPVATFLYLGCDDREDSVKGQVEAARRCTDHGRFDSLVRIGELGAVVPPTFADLDRTRAVIRTHDAPILEARLVLSDDMQRCRVAVSALQQRSIVVVACAITVDGALTLVRVAVASHDTLPPLCTVFALSAAPPLHPASIERQGDPGCWAPSVAAAAGSKLLVWAADAHGADKLVNSSSRPHASIFEGHTGNIDFVAFSPGGAKVCAVDSTGSVIVWGSLESPCPGLILGTTTIEGPVQAVLFAMPHEVWWVSRTDVMGWNCQTSHVRKVIDRPTPLPFEHNFLLSHRPRITTVSAADAVEGNSESVIVTRPYIDFTFVAKDSLRAVSYWESEATAGGQYAPCPSPATTLAVHDSPAGSMLDRSLRIIPSPHLPLVVDTALNRVRLVTPDGRAPSTCFLSVAAGSSDDQAAARDAAFSGPYVPIGARCAGAPFTSVTTVRHWPSGIDYVAIGTRRRLLRGIGLSRETGGEQLSCAVEVSGAVFAVVRRGTDAPPVSDLVAF
jgi:energy-coupling factor transporter ATP-binding protein EcfA2